MSYLDNGYNKLLYKNTKKTSPKEMTEDEVSQILSQVSGSLIKAGKIEGDKMEINLTKGYISIRDGAYIRVFLGEDGL